jgi:hypothetical protein
MGYTRIQILMTLDTVDNTGALLNCDVQARAQLVYSVRGLERERLATGSSINPP